MIQRVYKAKKVKKKACAVCKTLFEQKTSFIKWCSPACGYELAKRKLEKKKKEELKEWRKEYKERKEKDKKLSDYEADARRVFQKWIRRRDQDQPCISCGREKSPFWDGGHLFKCELYSGLMFDERNVHKQCRKCNFYLGGNEAGYKDGLIVRYGEAFVKELEAEKDQARVKKYSKEEYQEIKKEYNRRLKEL